MEAIEIGTRREVCWDEFLMEEQQGVSVRMHQPEYRGVVFTCDKPWEGNVSGYFQVFRDHNRIRLYYRGSHLECDSDGHLIAEHPTYFCYAESMDGKTFTRMETGLEGIPEPKGHNIFFAQSEDNLFVFRDLCPTCPEEERYKGLMSDHGPVLVYCKSRDGIHFEKVCALDIDDGMYDSMNIAFWDPNTQQYYLYYRGFHGEIRDVRVRTSRDFVHWGPPQQLDFGPDTEDYALYTNQIKPYYRADHIFLGIPTRYAERREDAVNFKYLPDRKNRINQVKNWGRSGTAMTDCVLMTSRDGKRFRRTDEVFLSAGIERDCNWYYGDGYVAWGMLETEGDREGAPHEISLYMGCDYRVNPVKLCRYALRLDGFFSWHCDFKPGYVLTRPIIFRGAELSVNFSTSALGYVRILLCDEDGNPLPGYDSGRLFGDSTDRPVEFQRSLEELSGKPVRIRFEMKDAELYSFCFREASPI